MTGCWACSVAVEPMPVTAEPDATSAATTCAPPPLSPLTWSSAQLDPVAEVQI